MTESKQKLTKREKIIIGCAAGAVVATGVIFLVYTKNLRVAALARHSVSSCSAGGDINVGSHVSKVIDNSRTFINVARQGPPSFVTECVETGARYASQTAAAIAAGVPSKMMSDHLNGKIPHVNGKVYQRIGMAFPTEDFGLTA